MVADARHRSRDQTGLRETVIELRETVIDTDTHTAADEV
jgi:hypothetical protein